MTDEQRREFQRLIQWHRKQIIECEHCKRHRGAIVEIYNVMPPDPIYLTQEQYTKLLVSEEQRKYWLEGSWDDAGKKEPEGK